MKKISPDDYFSYAETLIRQMQDSRRFGTAQTYTKAVVSFKKYLESCKEPTTLAIEDITSTLIDNYNQYLSRCTIIRNSVSFYNRTLRSIYNKAVETYDLPDRRPFARVYTGVDKTHSRAIGEKTISKIMRLDLSANKSLEFARDLFVFSFVMRGMPFVDMAFLKKSSIQCGYVYYTRKKTGTPLAVKLEPIARQIMQKYDCQGEYVFPIITEEDPSLAYRQYQSEMSVFNRRLKTISVIVGQGISLSSYVARHSWATTAMNSEVPISVISASLGHSSERVTKFYLGALDECLIDKANSRVLRKINGFWRQGSRA